MREEIIKIIEKYEEIDDKGHAFINTELKTENLVNELLEVITVTRCCKSDSELLKDKPKLSFEDWYINYGYAKSVTGNFVKEGTRYTPEEMQFKYDYNMP
tara:strand:- start:2031 stop:2330 length:300 start_codon:yes stop_codon:yes gene_type:complete